MSGGGDRAAVGSASAEPPRGLAVKGLRLGLRGQHPLVELDAHVGPGRILTVMGPSGSGKSTLLAFLCGTLPPAFEARGRVTLDGRDLTGLPPERRGVGVLFQDALLFPHLSVAGNLLFALPPAVRGRADRRRKVDAALEAAGLAGLGERDPATLSGGQALRVALLRTLLSEPRTLLLDEPFASLDRRTRERARELVLSEVRDRGLPAVLVTHEPEDARAAGGRVFELGG